ncbi:Chitinase A1 [Psilocybe cubensis]|uniref:Chitinase A1 n=1 Tax=Psilocybe cubensis TaxID=181762 RepID=A0ACB8H3E6_PSICU|nr:Chitinase A1 [Psilocybe cubensis]KAH9482515.1 Chitinase A1 [Psilocybe cubensis]
MANLKSLQLGTPDGILIQLRAFRSLLETTSDVNFLDLSGSNPDLLPQFVSEAHKNGVKALVSIGGWTGSTGFSTNVGSADNRTAFVKTVLNLAKKYKLDGIDFDWEYPANQGIGCNAINPNDTANFLAFLQELRKDSLGSTLILSAAVATVPFFGPNGSPLADVSGFAKVLDYIAIMNYDIWGPWSSSVGPNAPLNDTCASPANQQGSAVSAVQRWNQAGIPFHQIVLGVAAYGHSFKVSKADAFVQGSNTQLVAYPSFDATAHPSGDAWDDGAGVDECGNAQAPGGDVDFWGMVAGGYLKADGTPNDGIAFRFDSCSQTPYAYNSTTEIMVSFDNAQSFAAKGNFIREANLRGFATWEAGGDFNDILLDSIRKAAGF